jgi:hypothetical protein
MAQGVLSRGGDDRLEAQLQPVLNFFGKPFEILFKRYAATVLIAADYWPVIAR